MRQEMAAAGLPANVQRRLRGLIQATDRLCGTAEGGCAATTKRVQAALNEIWEWDPPGLWGPPVPMAEDGPADAAADAGEEELKATKAELATLAAAAEEALVQMNGLASQVQALEAQAVRLNSQLETMAAEKAAAAAKVAEANEAITNLKDRLETQQKSHQVVRLIESKVHEMM